MLQEAKKKLLKIVAMKCELEVKRRDKNPITDLI